MHIVTIKRFGALQERRSRLRIASTAHPVWGRGLTKLQEAGVALIPELGMAKYVDAAELYGKELEKSRGKVAIPRGKNVLEKEDSEFLADCVDSSLHMLDSALEADVVVRPMLFYYSVAQLFGAWSRTYLHWVPENRDSHGLSFNRNDRDVGESKITLQDDGFFPRLESMLWLIYGQGSVFSRVLPLPYEGGRVQEYRRNRKLPEVPRNDRAVRELSLKDLVEFSVERRVEEAEASFGVDKTRLTVATRLLLDVLLLYTASCLSRYNPRTWKEVLLGRKYSYRLHFDAVFERSQGFAVDYALALMENPARNLGQSLESDVGHPYWR
jgi:hypothetical protein